MKLLLTCIALTLFSIQSHALIVNASAKLKNDNQLIIDYGFTAEDFDVDAFSLFFDALLFENIAVTNNPAPNNWDLFAVQSEDFFGELDDGYVDFVTLVDPLFANESITGFQVSVDLLGSAVPSSFSQTFEIYDLDFNLVGEGNVQIEVAALPVNSPAMFSFILALIVAGGLLRSKSATNNRGQL